MMELTAPMGVQIHIDTTTRRVWINTEKGCQFSARGVGLIAVEVDGQVLLDEGRPQQHTQQLSLTM